LTFSQVFLFGELDELAGILGTSKIHINLFCLI
jgi:hypothetical protein